MKLFLIKANFDILLNPIEYLKGVGPQRADLLKKELNIFTFKDLLCHFPYRHVDKSTITLIRDIGPQVEYVQVLGKLTSLETIGDRRSRRLVAEIRDDTGVLDLIWFQGINWVDKTLKIGQTYKVFGRLSFFQSSPQISHPEMEIYSPEKTDNGHLLEPVYPTTEKLKSRGLGGRQMGKLTQQLLTLLKEKDIPEILPGQIIRHFKFLSRFQAFSSIHFPEDQRSFTDSLNRLKFEELFLSQIRIGQIKSQRHRYSKGFLFRQVGELFNKFYSGYLPFELTAAQKRVLKEIRKDTGSGKQMNRLLQGDVGSGKTIVALLSMLLAADNGYQSCLLSPTEILARQHYQHFKLLLKDLPISVKLLTGSTRAKERKQIVEEANSGNLDILIGTHAIIEDYVQLNNLGLAIVDEQHRF